MELIAPATGKVRKLLRAREVRPVGHRRGDLLVATFHGVIGGERV